MSVPETNTRKRLAAVIRVGQIWREQGQNVAFAREIVNVQGDALSMSVQWRRPGRAGLVWCDTRRFFRWIEDTKAACND